MIVAVHTMYTCTIKPVKQHVHMCTYICIVLTDRSCTISSSVFCCTLTESTSLKTSTTILARHDITTNWRRAGRQIHYRSLLCYSPERCIYSGTQLFTKSGNMACYVISFILHICMYILYTCGHTYRTS